MVNATFVLNGYTSLYGYTLELIRSAVKKPAFPVLNLSYVTTIIQNIQRSVIQEY